MKKILLLILALSAALSASSAWACGRLGGVWVHNMITTPVDLHVDGQASEPLQPYYESMGQLGKPLYLCRVQKTQDVKKGDIAPNSKLTISLYGQKKTVDLQLDRDFGHPGATLSLTLFEDHTVVSEHGRDVVYPNK